MCKYGPLEILGNLEAMRLASETICRPIQCFSKARQLTEFHMCEYYPFCPLALRHTALAGFGFLIICLFRKPHLLQMRLARQIICLEEGEIVERKTRRSSSALFCSHLSSFNMSPLSNGANWQVREKVVWLKPD